jgi:hypothetical protein
MEGRRKNNKRMIYEGVKNKYGGGLGKGGKSTKVYISIYLHICIFIFNYLPKLHWISYR